MTLTIDVLNSGYLPMFDRLTQVPASKSGQGSTPTLSISWPPTSDVRWSPWMLRPVACGLNLNNVGFVIVALFVASFAICAMKVLAS